MMNEYARLRIRLQADQKIWTITGVAGFIGSNLLEALLRLDQKVVGIDNFSTGSRSNLEEVRSRVSGEQWANFEFVEGDICKRADCDKAMRFHGAGPAPLPVDVVLHQAALGSVPRSIDDPISTNLNNVNGFLSVMVAARDAGVSRMIYAASSSTYGDHPGSPKIEDRIGRPLSPYAVTKLVNELYAEVFSRTYGFDTIGLRYFNVFGPRQQPNGAYAAVIPKWISGIIQNEPVFINGDGDTSRDFCYIDNVVQANLLAASTTDVEAVNQVYNVAVGEQTTLQQLYSQLRHHLAPYYPAVETHQVKHRDYRRGDVRHSLADISKARRLLGYEPSHTVIDGIKASIVWYINRNTHDIGR